MHAEFFSACAIKHKEKLHSHDETRPKRSAASGPVAALSLSAFFLMNLEPVSVHSETFRTAKVTRKVFYISPGFSRNISCGQPSLQPVLLCVFPCHLFIARLIRTAAGGSLFQKTVVSSHPVCVQKIGSPGFLLGP